MLVIKCKNKREFLLVIKNLLHESLEKPAKTCTWSLNQGPQSIAHQMSVEGEKGVGLPSLLVSHLRDCLNTAAIV